MEPIKTMYSKLRLAQDLNKRILNQIGMRLLRKGENGLFNMPSDNEIATYLNDLAEKGLIKHYVLTGEYEKVYLFHSDDILYDLDIQEVEAKKITAIVKIQCYDEKITNSDNVPVEISRIEDLYKLPKTLFNSGSCIYFLCRENKVVYVGQALNIHARLVEHHRCKNFDNVFYIRVSANRLNIIENSLIAYLKPEYNQTNNPLNNQRRSIAECLLKEMSVTGSQQMGLETVNL